MFGIGAPRGVGGGEQLFVSWEYWDDIECEWDKLGEVNKVVWGCER